jgi:hypothetical protein
MLSQGPMATRPLPAGPLTPVEGAQLQRVVTVSYAVALGDVDPYALADDVLVPLVVAEDGPALAASHGTVRGATPTGGDGARPRGRRSGTPLAVSGAEVSAVRREGSTLVVRVFNPTGGTTTVTVEGRSGWLVDLRGRPLTPFDGSIELRPHGIATLAMPD